MKNWKSYSWAVGAVTAWLLMGYAIFAKQGAPVMVSLVSICVACTGMSMLTHLPTPKLIDYTAKKKG